MPRDVTVRHSRFAVDDVTPASDPPDLVEIRVRLGFEWAAEAEQGLGRLRSGVRRLLGRRRAGADGLAARPIVVAASHPPGTKTTLCAIHPLLGAAHQAWNEHRGFVLNPDAAWITILQGVAAHVNSNSEALRAQFVSHQGKRKLEVLLEREDYALLVERICARLANDLNDDVGDILRAEFSTTGPIERVASQIVLMDTFKAYYDYEGMVICGIPEVVIEGSPEDWEDIASRLERLAQYELSWWTSRLAPIVREIAAARRGKVRPSFWASLLTTRPAYEADSIAGWLLCFYPYVKVKRGGWLRNGFVERVQFEDFLLGPGEEGYGRGRGVGFGRGGRVPGRSPSRDGEDVAKDQPIPGLSTVVVWIRTHPGGPQRPMEVVGGLVGVQPVREYGGALRPFAGWFALEPRRADVLSHSVEAGKGLAAPSSEGLKKLWEELEEAHQGSSRAPRTFASDLQEVYARTNGGRLTCADGREAVLLPADQLSIHRIDPTTGALWVRIGRTGDGADLLHVTVLSEITVPGGTLECAAPGGVYVSATGVEERVEGDLVTFLAGVLA